MVVEPLTNNPIQLIARLRVPRWLIQLVVVVVMIRLVLTIGVLLGAQWPELAEGVRGTHDNLLNPQTLPGVWARWDSGNYLRIAQAGYDVDPLDVNFFPLYPLTINLLSLGQPALMSWAAWLIPNLAFLIAAAVLWREIQADFGPKVAWVTVIALNLFPTALYFSAVYAESLLLLWSVLTYSLARRGHYLLAAGCVGLASVTRITGWLLVVIPLIELLRLRPRGWVKQALIVALVASMLLSAYCLYLWATRGSPVAFLLTQAEAMKRSITWPLLPVIDSVRTLLTGYGGYEHNWLMRVLSAFDLAAMGLLISGSILALRWLRPSLAGYAIVGTLFLSVSHGPYTLGVMSVSRYILPIFPIFMVLGIVLERVGGWRRALWLGCAVLLFVLTLWFGSGRWIS